MKCYRNRIEDGPFLHYRNKHVSQWRLHLAVGLLCGILLAIWNGNWIIIFFITNSFSFKQLNINF